MWISRRDILGFAAVAASALLPTLAGAGAGPELFASPSAARAVGRRYLALYPEERDVATLQEALFSGQARIGGTALRQHVATLCRRDFAAGDTVIVDGWILARSEARACALSAMAALPR
ncbi:MAG: hypothetical protein ACTSX7_00060 [Alphaproteobacteria bacterium]